MDAYDFVKGVARRRADVQREQSIIIAATSSTVKSTASNETPQSHDGGSVAEFVNRAKSSNERRRRYQGVHEPTQTVTLDSGKMALLIVRGSNHGHTRPVTVWVSGKGGVACDGDYIYKSRVLDAGRRSYVLTSWGGRVTVTFLTSEAECVYDDKTNTPGSMVLNVLSIQNVLVLDETHSTALTAANYAYAFGTADGYTDSGAQCTFDTVFVDISVKSNAGAVYVYPMQSAAPPGRFHAQPEDGTGHTVTFRGDPLTDCDQIRLLRPVDDLQFVVRRHVFENAAVAPHHIMVDAALNARLLRFVLGNIRSGGDNYKRMLVHALPGKGFEGNREYAVVSFVVPEDLNCNTFPDMCGFAYCDTNKYVHCLFPEPMCKTKFYFIELGRSVLT
ncbi:hypothetical protein EGW08_022539 [Elysia chlorotica]|uniref:Uncharacterized protein n=1 Tax=Elysia chlorotica TaxID=188477 RepID=A0A3S1AXC2_ELYCH|nr:hypothetical protein EGW08_022539 [Elysia chlorotica]